MTPLDDAEVLPRADAADPGRAEDLAMTVWWLTGAGLLAVVAGTTWLAVQLAEPMRIAPAWLAVNPVMGAGGALMLGGALVARGRAAPTRHVVGRGLELGVAGAILVLAAGIGPPVFLYLAEAGPGGLPVETLIEASGNLAAPVCALVLAARCRWGRPRGPLDPAGHGHRATARRRLGGGVIVVVGVAELARVVPVLVQWGPAWAMGEGWLLTDAIGGAILALVGLELVWRAGSRQCEPRRLLAFGILASLLAGIGAVGWPLWTSRFGAPLRALEVGSVVVSVAHVLVLALAAATPVRFSRR